MVGYPHAVKGEAIYAYVILNAGVEPSDTLRTELKNIVRKVCARVSAREREGDRGREGARKKELEYTKKYHGIRRPVAQSLPTPHPAHFLPSFPLFSTPSPTHRSES